MTEELSDFILMDATQARRALGDHALHFSVVRPFGNWLGQGALRVLRIRTTDTDGLELLTGYERYVRESLI